MARPSRSVVEQRGDGGGEDTHLPHRERMVGQVRASGQMHNGTEDLGLGLAEISIVAQPVTCGVLCAPVRRITLSRVHRIVSEPPESVDQPGRRDRQLLLCRREPLVRASCKLHAERRSSHPVPDRVPVNADALGDPRVGAPIEQLLDRLVPARVNVWLARQVAQILTNRLGLVDGDLVGAWAVELVCSRDDRPRSQAATRRDGAAAPRAGGACG